MRTTLQSLVYGIRNILSSNERRYSVSGQVCFVLSSARVEPDLNTLRQAILAVDALHPWKDKNHFTDEEAESIKYLSDGSIKIDEWNIPEKSCWFGIYPGIENLTKGQLHAYERYLTTIAKELAKRQLLDVSKVRCGITTHTSFEFSGQ